MTPIPITIEPQIPLNISEALPLQDSDSISLTSRVGSCARRFFNHPYTQAGLTLVSVVGIATSVSILSPKLDQYVGNCINQLNDFSSDLAACRAPYQPIITACESVIGISSGILGYMMQRFWEHTPQPEVTPQRWNRVTKKIAEIQDSCSYEFHLGLGYLYNGLWVDVSTPSSWKFYFNSQAASIALASAFLGMFARIQYKTIQARLSQNNDDQAIEEQAPSGLQNNWKLALLSGSSIALIILTSTIPASFPGKSLGITRDLCVMNLGRPLGHLFANKIHQYKSYSANSLKGKAISILCASVKIFPAPLVGLGYAAYIPEGASIGARLFGMGLIGSASGIKNAYYKKDEEVNPPASENAFPALSPCKKIACKVWKFTKEYWRTGALICFAITIKETSLIKCYNIDNFNCPIGFELSGNYVNIDGDGLNIIITAGLANYYAIKLFKYICSKTTHPIKKAPETYLHLVDKYQFEALSMIPYAMINAGTYLRDYHAFATFNDPVLLTLIGFTMGTYNEKIHAGQANNPYRPAFTDTSVLASLI